MSTLTLSRTRYRPANHTGPVRDKETALRLGRGRPPTRRPTRVNPKTRSVITGPPAQRRKSRIYSHTWYDANGNETYKVNAGSGATWEYSYNSVDELTNATEYASDPRIPGTGHPVLAQINYNYDAFGEMIQKNDGTVVSRFCQDGWNSNMPPATGNANMNAWAVLNGSNVWQERDISGDTVDQALGRIVAGTPNYGLYSLADRQQSVRDVIDATAAVKADIVYDAWGNITNTPNATYRGWYAWTGRQFDVETNLQYNRARWYDAATGRWITQDPMGFDAGDSNLYRYANNAPTDGSDPTGEFLDGFFEALTRADEYGLPWDVRYDVAPRQTKWGIEVYAGGEIGNWATEIGDNIATKVEKVVIARVQAKELNLSDAQLAAVKNHNGLENAARHLAWQAAITVKYGFETALVVGAVHDDISVITTQDQAIDLYNNRVGRTVGLAVLKDLRAKHGSALKFSAHPIKGVVVGPRGYAVNRWTMDRFDNWAKYSVEARYMIEKRVYALVLRAATTKGKALDGLPLITPNHPYLQDSPRLRKLPPG